MSFFLKILLASFFYISSLSAVVVTFPSEESLRQAVYPLTPEEVNSRIHQTKKPHNIEFKVDANCPSKMILLRAPALPNLLQTPLFKTPELTIYYPEKPRTPDHLCITFNCRSLQGITAISPQENYALFAMIKKIAEIYQSIGIQGFVVSRHDVPQAGHNGKHVIEIIPHLPGFHFAKHIMDKMDCNRHVLFRTAALSPVNCLLANRDDRITFWQQALAQKWPPLCETDLKIVLPSERKEIYQERGDQLLLTHLLELLEAKGGFVEDKPICDCVLPLNPCHNIQSVPMKQCAFCNDEVICRQQIYEYKSVRVLCNIRKTPRLGSNFLILPARHTEKIYSLTCEEIETIRQIRQALVEILHETHPDCEIVDYIQDDPCVGQTVPHTHEQLIAIDPKTMAWTWTFMSLYPSGNLSDEEIMLVRNIYREKLKQKLEPDYSINASQSRRAPSRGISSKANISGTLFSEAA